MTYRADAIGSDNTRINPLNFIDNLDNLKDNFKVTLKKRLNPNSIMVQDDQTLKVYGSGSVFGSAAAGQ